MKPGGNKPGLLTLTIKDKSALYLAYMPFVRNGGLFIPTNSNYRLGDEVFMLLNLMGEDEKLPVAVGLKRARERSGIASDRFEAETESFFERVRAGYLDLARREPKRIRIIDASAALPEVERQVTAVVDTLVKL